MLIKRRNDILVDIKDKGLFTIDLNFFKFKAILFRKLFEQIKLKTEKFQF